MVKIPDMDTLILAAVLTLLVLVLGTLKSISGTFRKEKDPSLKNPPKPVGVVKAAHEAVDTKAEEEQNEIEKALKEPDPGKAIAELINRRRR
tara:strand:- start:391 stop:666 length:276 start_codon:yes stop_codon:yes gene_type:complete